MSEQEPISLVKAGEHISGAAFMSGIPVGVQRAIDFLNEQAGLAYSRRDDKQAQSLRDAADLLIPFQKKQQSFLDADTEAARKAAYIRLEKADEALEAAASKETAPS